MNLGTPETARMDDPYSKIFIDINGQPEMHDFYKVRSSLFNDQCTLDYWNIAGDRTYVTVRQNLKENHLELHPSTPTEGVPLEHAPLCPLRFLSSSSALPNKFVRLGVCVLVENDRGDVLITRRASFMRTCIL